MIFNTYTSWVKKKKKARVTWSFFNFFLPETNNFFFKALCWHSLPSKVILWKTWIPIAKARCIIFVEIAYMPRILCFFSWFPIFTLASKLNTRAQTHPGVRKMYHCVHTDVTDPQHYPCVPSINTRTFFWLGDTCIKKYVIVWSPTWSFCAWH